MSYSIAYVATSTPHTTPLGWAATCRGWLRGWTTTRRMISTKSTKIICIYMEKDVSSHSTQENHTYCTILPIFHRHLVKEGYFEIHQSFQMAVHYCRILPNDRLAFVVHVSLALAFVYHSKVSLD